MIKARPRPTWRLVCAAIPALALVIAGCGGHARATSSAPLATPPAGSAIEQTQAAGGFGWVQHDASPSGWSMAVIPSGASLPYPPGWKRASGDAGTATAELLDSRERIVGYLNLTPRQGGETLADWARFRVAHNAQEGDRAVTSLAVGTGLHFRTGRGSCVRDSYTTITGNHYVELACIVAGPKGTSVIVGASAPQDWRQVSPLLQVAIASFTT